MMCGSPLTHDSIVMPAFVIFKPRNRAIDPYSGSFHVPVFHQGNILKPIAFKLELRFALQLLASLKLNNKVTIPQLP